MLIKRINNYLQICNDKNNNNLYNEVLTTYKTRFNKKYYSCYKDLKKNYLYFI